MRSDKCQSTLDYEKVFCFWFLLDIVSPSGLRI